ncbi:hypothetical protein RMS29_028625 (plasmid) [Agrobacterium rosae]|uniref:Uncharacterized protein n=1 Tax=Agrobacterium rosae TaxID=1972867 RepID=A0ABU4W5D7_9HYPH|nr:hypothetical protein [Agrobacterium rosae]MDX8333007.1 hypothetical protein [Agrobacterium rosae]
MFHRSRKAGERLSQGIVAHVEQGQLVQWKACTMRLSLGLTLGLGMYMIVGRGRGRAKPAKELLGAGRKGEPISVAGLLDLWPASLVAGWHVAPEPI